MTPEQAYEALLRNGGRRVDDSGYTGHPYHWYFDSKTGVLCLACRCGFKSDFPQFVRPASEEPDHDLAYDLPTPEWLSLLTVVPEWIDPGASE